MAGNVDLSGIGLGDSPFANAFYLYCGVLYSHDDLCQQLLLGNGIDDSAAKFMQERGINAAETVRQISAMYLGDLIVTESLKIARSVMAENEDVALHTYESMEDPRIKVWEDLTKKFQIAASTIGKNAAIAAQASALVIAYLHEIYAIVDEQEFDDTHGDLFTLGLEPTLPDLISFLSPLRVVVLNTQENEAIR